MYRPLFVPYPDAYGPLGPLALMPGHRHQAAQPLQRQPLASRLSSSGPSGHRNRVEHFCSPQPLTNRGTSRVYWTAAPRYLPGNLECPECRLQLPRDQRLPQHTYNLPKPGTIHKFNRERMRNRNVPGMSRSCGFNFVQRSVECEYRGTITLNCSFRRQTAGELP